ncbi:hypothetical protein GB937_003860 [Aspergillus fischeri]|nr:hypothetical protein GB937_003860 [Aspergillus fischeri]
MTWPPIPAENSAEYSVRFADSLAVVAWPIHGCRKLRRRQGWREAVDPLPKKYDRGSSLVEAENPQSTYISGEPRWPSLLRLAELGGLNLHNLCTKFCQTIEDLQARI